MGERNQNYFEIRCHCVTFNSMNAVDKGTLLIAEPFLKDENFRRSVVLLCEHDFTGTFGIAINRPTETAVADLLDGIGNHELKLFDGGPVGKDHVHFLHRLPSHISGGVPIADEIYWGGDLEEAKYAINSGIANENNIRFYLGYSGWGESQLTDEMNEKSWLSIPAAQSLVFHPNCHIVWKDAVKRLGKEFLPIINYPLDPSLN